MTEWEEPLETEAEPEPEAETPDELELAPEPEGAEALEARTEEEELEAPAEEEATAQEEPPEEEEAPGVAAEEEEEAGAPLEEEPEGPAAELEAMAEGAEGNAAQRAEEALEEVEAPSEGEVEAAGEGEPGAAIEEVVEVAPEQAQALEGGGEGGPGGAEPTMAAVRAQIQRRASAIQVAPITAGTSGAGSVRSTAVSRAELLRIKAAEVPRSAEKALPPVPEGVPEILPTPQDPVPGARRHVEEKSGRTLPAQSSPALTASPFGNTPRVGDQPLAADMIRQLHRVLEEGPPYSDPNDEARMRLLALRERLLDQSTPEPGQGKPVVLQEPRPPERPNLTPGHRTQAASAIARLIASKGQEARQMVSRARRSAYPNGALERVEATATLGDDSLTPELEQALDQQLQDIATEAGIAREDLQTAVNERHTLLEERRLAEEEELAMSLPGATSEVSSAGQSVNDAVDGSRTWMEARARAVESGATSPSAAINAQRDALIGDVNRRVAQADALYRRAAETREQDLTRIEREQLSAYQAAAQRDEFQLNENRGERTQLEVQQDVARSTDWLRERTAFVRREILRMKQEARDSARTHRDELSTAGDEAREMIRQWADTQRGEERGFWERLFDMIQDWRDQARATADAWQTLQNQETAQALSSDLDMIDRVQRAAAAGITEQELVGSNQLTAEEQAIVHAYFNPDPAEGPRDPIGAVAAGMRERIFNQRKGRLEEQLRSALTSSTLEWTVFEQVARASGNSRFDAAHLASELYHSFHGGLTGAGTDEDRAYRAMAGLGPIEALALRKCYSQVYHRNLDSDVTSEFSGGELQRARALLAGDRARADVAALYSAMHETMLGTGLGTDEDAIMRTLRNKTPAEVEEIIRLYQELYHQDLRKQLRGELDDWATLTTHDSDRANALLRSDQAAADAIAVDQQLHGFSWANAFNVTYGTSFEAGARDEVAAIYDQVRTDVAEQADREGWTSEQMDAELTRRTQAISRAYGREYGATWGGLEQNLQTRFSGPSEDLVVALSRNDPAGADAARLAIERQSTFYADDREMNRVLESQYDRSLEDVRRDLAPERRRALMADLDAEEQAHFRETGHRWTPAERWRRQQLVERQLLAELETEARRRADRRMERLSDRYAGQYGESVQRAIRESTSGDDRTRAQILLRQGGYLTRYQRFDFSVRGAGTSEEDARRSMEGASREELEQMRARWAREHPGETLDERALGELSGTDAMDMRISLMGAPETIEDRLRVERARMALEQPTNVFGASIAGPEKEIMRVRMAQLEAAAGRMDQEVTPAERARLLDDFDFQAGAMQTAVQDHRSAVAEITDSVANAVGIAVAVIVGAVGAIFTGGASAAVALAIIASLASTAASVGTRYLLMGNQYGHEELLMDLGLGVLDAVVAGLTAGFGNRLLGISQLGRAAAPVVTRAGIRGVAQRMSISLGRLLERLGNTGRVTQATRSIATLERMAQGPWYARLAAHGISQTMENAVQSLPTAVVGNVLNDQAWERGNPLVHILRGTTEQLGHGLAMGLAMSAGHSSASHLWGAASHFLRGPRLGGAPGVVGQEHLLTTPEAREAALREYTQRNPGKTEADFDALVGEQRRRQLEDFLAGGQGRTEADFDAMLQTQRNAQLAEYQQMHPGRTQADFDAEVGRRSGQAHSDVEVAEARRESVRKSLEEDLPEEARALAREVPVTEVSRAEMGRLTGNPMADVAVVVRDGQVHVVVREGASPDAVRKALREHTGRLVALVEPGTGGRAKNLSLSLPSDLRNRVDVYSNPDLEGGSVQVHYETHEGLIVGVWVEVGPNARAVDIHMHVETVRSMRQLQGMSGRVRRLLDQMGQWLGRNPRAGPGTRAWEAQLELEKLPRIIEERAQALRLSTDPEERARLAYEIESLRLQVEEHSLAVRSFEQEPGRGYVAAQLPDPETVNARLADLPPEIRQVLRDAGPLVEAYVAMYSAPFRTLLETNAQGHFELNEANLARARTFAEVLQRLLGGPGTTALGAPHILPMAETHLHMGGLLEPEHIVRQVEAAIEQATTPGTKRQRESAASVRNRWMDAVESLLSGRDVATELTPQEQARFKQAQDDARQALNEFRSMVEEHLRNPTPESLELLVAARENLTQRIQNVVSLPLADVQLTPLLERFFPEFVRQKSFLLDARMRTELITMAIRDLTEHGVSMVELRQGLSKQVEAWFRANPDLVQGLIVTQVRNYAADPRFIPDIMARIREGKLGFVLGFDLSGLEAGGLGKDAQGQVTRGLREEWLKPLAEVHRFNQEQLTLLLASEEALRGPLQQQLATGNDPRLHMLRTGLGLGPEATPQAITQALNQAISEGRMGPRDLALWNRVLREAIEQVGAQHSVNYLAPKGDFRGLLGVTVHAGEQIRGRIALTTLLDDVGLVLDSGSDRVGHGVILGTSFADPVNPSRVNAQLLTSLGFTEKNGVWIRGSERYTADDILSMERTRRRLLTQAENLGVVIEINPTSNVMLSGLDPRAPHPLAQMLNDAPNLRASVNTDNAGMHLTDPRLELAYLMATGTLTYPQAIRVMLEGFATRMGGRPLAEVGPLRQQMEDALVAATRVGHERTLVLEELARRYGFPPPSPNAGIETDDGAFRQALQPYLKFILQ